MKRYFRVFEEKRGMPATLFHGVHGSRKLPLDEWVNAEIKLVKDGTNGKIYQSGFHVFLDRDETIAFFLRLFRHLEDRVIASVDVDKCAGIWSKEHSRGNVFLAARIRIRSREWKNREYLENQRNR